MPCSFSIATIITDSIRFFTTAHIKPDSNCTLQKQKQTRLMYRAGPLNMQTCICNTKCVSVCVCVWMSRVCSLSPLITGPVLVGTSPCWLSTLKRCDGRLRPHTGMYLLSVTWWLCPVYTWQWYYGSCLKLNTPLVPSAACFNLPCANTTQSNK